MYDLSSLLFTAVPGVQHVKLGSDECGWLVELLV